LWSGSIRVSTFSWERISGSSIILGNLIIFGDSTVFHICVFRVWFLLDSPLEGKVTGTSWRFKWLAIYMDTWKARSEEWIVGLSQVGI
jgi:hypothetical protein